jgi:hypothetical protein
MHADFVPKLKIGFEREIAIERSHSLLIINGE